MMAKRTMTKEAQLSQRRTGRYCPRRSGLIGLLCAILLTAEGASAQTPDGPAHEGLMVRLTTGIGGSSASDSTSPVIELSGATGFFSFDIGGTLSRGLALHARLSANTLVNPTVSVAGEELGDEEDASLTFGLLGLGLTYYFPSNLYLTGVVGLSKGTVEVGGEESESETGVGVAGDLGYEWAVGGNWGLGIAGRLEHHSVPSEGDRVTGTALGLLFTATCH
jgi:hypothetical protein